MEIFLELLNQARFTHSDAVVIRQFNREILVERFGKPKQLIPTMSITKSIVSLAFGKLFSLGLVNTNEPLSSYYPEWKQGKKQHITLRHIMNHTSGLQNVPITTEEIYPSPDFIQLALCAELSSEPGQLFAYNNKAVNLLAGVVEKISGHKLDVFMEKEIFKPLNILEFEWETDNAGNPQVMAGLSLYPEDLAKLGQLALNQGIWQGEKLIDEVWITESFRPHRAGSEVGLLWWLAPDQSFIYSNGYLGQYLILFPKQQLVFVRMISDENVIDEEKDGFGDFIPLTRDIAKCL